MTLPETANWTYLLKVRVCYFNALLHECLSSFNHYSPSQLSLPESLRKGSCCFFVSLSCHMSLCLLMSVFQSLHLSLSALPLAFLLGRVSATVQPSILSTNLYLLTLHLRNLFPLDVWLNCIKWLLYQPSKSIERESAENSRGLPTC